MTVEDWEVGALYWRLVDEGASPEEAAEKVKQKFLGEICAPEKETSGPSTCRQVGTRRQSHLTGQAICHFEIAAEGICQLHLPWRAAFRFEESRGADHDRYAFCPRCRDVKPIETV